MNIYAPFTERQADYIRRSLTAWFNVAEGGKRGGKNVINTLAFAIALETHPSTLHLAAGVSLASAKLNIFACDGFGLVNYFEGRCREGKYKNRDALYIRNQRGADIVVLASGGAKDGDEKYIKGNSYGCAYITEANECHPKFIQEVFDRTIASPARKVFHDLNPKAPRHFYYTDILGFHQRQQDENPGYGLNYGHFTIADNMSISDEQLRVVLSTYDKRSLWYSRDILGQRIAAGGLVYDRFDPRLHCVPAEKRDYTKYYVSCDYGTQNPTVFLLWGHCGGVWYLVKEYYYSGRDNEHTLTNSEYLSVYRKFTEGLRITAVIIDPSASSFIAELTRAGIRYQKARNDVVEGIRATGDCLNLGKIKINETCEHTIGEFGLYMWDDKSPDDKPVKENDHAMDSARYFCYTILNNNTIRAVTRETLGGLL